MFRIFFQAAFKRLLKDTKSKMKPIVKLKKEEEKEEEEEEEDYENEEFKKRKQRWQVVVVVLNLISSLMLSLNDS